MKRKKEFNLSDYVFNPNNDNYQAISWIYVKQFIKEILEEIDNFWHTCAVDYSNESRENLKTKIKQKAGDKLR